MGIPKQVIEFKSWGEMIEYASQEPDQKANGGYYQSEGNGYEFNHTHNYAEALKLAFNGWPEGEAKARKLSNALFNKVSQLVEREHINYDVEGLDIDMGAYTRGEPECWIRFDKVLEESESMGIIRVVVNIGASGGVPAETILARGAVTAALIELLEYSGRRVEVTMYKQFSDELAFKTLLKSADQPLDLGRLIFAVAHPSMLRRLGFRIIELNPKAMKEVGFGYGHSQDAQKAEHGDIYMPRMYSADRDWSDPNVAEAWTIEQLRKHGVELSLDKQ